MTRKTSILIPARMASTRFPGKPLAPIDGIPMIVYCAKNAIKTGLEVFVCTDSKEIKAVCKLYSINVILTPECVTGTDRVSAAMQEINADNIINLQGDEPLIDSSALQIMISMISTTKMSNDIIINGVTSIGSEEAYDPNNVKCALVNKDKKIQYLSRKALLNKSDLDSGQSYYKQLGLYGMSREALNKFSTLPRGTLEQAEKIELLRWLENNNIILSCLIEQDNISVDTPIDLVNVLRRIEQLKSNR